MAKLTPENRTCHRQRMHSRVRIVQAMRQFFDARAFLEVDTPVVLSAPAPEPSIEAPEVLFAADVFETGSLPQRRFLQTSPELPMKRLLAAGFERIYQLAPVFRDGDFSPVHRPEFRLLEWYRRGEPWTVLLDDCEQLVRMCAAVIHGESHVLPFQGKSVDLSDRFRRVTVDEAFRQYAGFSIVECLDAEALRQQLRKAGVLHNDSDSWDDLFHRIFLQRVEPALIADAKPVFLTHYPSPLASLARLCPDDERVSERFELYVGGLELANGFGELTSASEQRQRFERDQSLRRERQMRDYPLDEHFLIALEELPPSSGIALGFDRLLMILLDVQHIEDIAFIPWSAS